MIAIRQKYATHTLLISEENSETWDKLIASQTLHEFSVISKMLMYKVNKIQFNDIEISLVSMTASQEIC